MSDSKEYLSPLPYHVVFLATSTDEKVRDFNIVAQDKDLPLKFFNLRDVAGTLHRTIEDGDSALANAEKKLQGVAGKIASCRQQPEKVYEFCKKRGIDPDPKRIWFGTEDSGVNLPQEIWDNLPEGALSSLPGDVQERLKLRGQRPGVETAPFLSASLGAHNMQQMIDFGIKRLEARNGRAVDLVSLQFEEISVLKVQPLQSIPKLQNNTITAMGVNQSCYVDRHQMHDPIVGRIANYHFISPPFPNDKQSAAEMGVQYIARHSVRTAALNALCNRINAVVDPEHRLKRVYGDKRYDLLTGIAVHPEEFHVGMVGGDTEESNRMEACLHRRGSHLDMQDFLPYEHPPHGGSMEEKATFYLSAPERLLSKNDGVVLMPDSASDPDQRMSLEEKVYLLSSLVVAKQLVPRDINKKVVVINTDHSWDDALRIHTDLANVCMTKDHALPLSPRLPNVDVVSNEYFDVVNGGQYEAAIDAAAALMKEHSLTYHRMEDMPSQTEKKGNFPGNDQNLTAIFCSASSENAVLEKHVERIAYQLAKAQQKIICGGGDRYTMGAILNGVCKFRSDLASDPELQKQLSDIPLSEQSIRDHSYVAGISTEPIAVSETNAGIIPEEYNYRELTPDIYTRMGRMLARSKNIVVAPGGAGTVQEWMGLNLLKQKMPAQFQDRKMVVFDPELMFEGRDVAHARRRVFQHVIDIMAKNNHGDDKSFIASDPDQVVKLCLASSKEGRSWEQTVTFRRLREKQDPTSRSAGS